MRSPMLRFAAAVPVAMRIGLSEAVAYRAEFVVWFLAYSMPLIMLALWTAVAREAPVGRFDESALKAYFMVTLIVRLVTGSWVAWELSMEVRTGSLGQGLFAGMLLGSVFFLLNRLLAYVAVVYHFYPLLAAALPAIAFLVAGALFLRRVR